MELDQHGATPSDEERAAIDAVLGVDRDSIHVRTRSGDGFHTARGGARHRAERHRLLAGLHAVNDRVGWISPGAVNHLAARLDIGPADVFGVATFYGLFATTERPRRQVHVCTDLVCRAAGSTEATVPAGAHSAPCLGVCERAPAALVIEAGDPARHAVAGPVTLAEVDAFVAGAWPDPEPPPVAAVPPFSKRGLDAGQGIIQPSDALQPSGGETVGLLGRVGRVEPTSIDDYRATGGYEALPRAVELGPAGVIDEVTAAGLVGRGGAAFPTARKWAAVAAQPVRPHYLIANADESEPGTFKDRVLIEGDPFALIEAMTIAAYATGCEHGWIYVRGEYPRATATLAAALAAARRDGALGPDVLGLGFAFDVEIERGAGAYICGEETAIFNSIEGYRGEPRNKPPFPVEVGLFGRPTLVNNVETLVNVPLILRHGAAAFRAIGTADSAGPKLFCLSGAVAAPGLYEVPFGITLRALLERAGGVRAGAELQAVLLGGAAGGYVGPDDLDLPLTLEDARAAGTTLGSGVVLVLDRGVDLTDQLLRIAAFFRDESCGQCVPCRVGTVRQQEALTRLAAGATDGDLRLLRDVAQVMRDASICGLGQTAPIAILSAIDRLGALR